MRRALIIVPVVAAIALGGVWAASVVAPCALPPALMAKIAPDKLGSCPAPAAADQPRAVEPPAVTVVPAVRREFVDRLFVSGTLVAREEAQVASRIDGLTIVEVDAEDGDQVSQGQVLARLDRTQLDALLAQNDACDQARRRGDRPGEEPDCAVRGAAAVRQRRLRPGAQADRRRDVGLHHRAARNGDEDGAGPVGGGQPRAERRSRPIARAATPSARSSWCGSTGRR